MDQNFGPNSSYSITTGGPPRDVAFLDAFSLGLSEEDHKELDQRVTSNRMVALLPKELENLTQAAFLLAAIIDKATELRSRLNQAYVSFSAAEELIQSKAWLLEELRVAWACKRFARIRSLRILQASPATPSIVSSTPQQASPYRTEADVLRAIDTFLTEIQPIMMELLEETTSPPTWQPKNMDHEVVEHIRNLHIPELDDSRPSLLLHGLGELLADDNMSYRLSKIFTPRNHTFVYNTPGSGKTRLLLEGLNLNWGLYFVCRPDSSKLGSSDLWWVIHEALDQSPGWTARLPPPDTSAFHDAVSTNEVIARPYLRRVLVARLLVMRLFLQTAIKREGALSPRHKQLWVLLQVAPVHYFKRHPDVFYTLCTSILNGISVWQLSNLAHSAARDIYKLIYDPLSPRQLFCVLDEAEVASNAHTTSFMSSNRVFQRPVLKKIVKDWGGCLPGHSGFIVAGTSPSIQIVEDRVGSSGEYTSFSYFHDTGAFNDRESQEAYIRRYVPAGYLSTVGGRELLERLWNWLHGRYHFTAAYVQLLLENGLRSPHRLLDSYVEQYTKYRPSDGLQTHRDEEPALAPDCVERLQSSCVVFGFEELKAHLMDYAFRIYFRYLIRRQVIRVSQVEIVRIGFAQFLNYSARVDERLALLSMANWLDTQQGFTFDAYLTKRMEKPVMQWKAFEDAIALYVCRVFQPSTPLTDVFDFFGNAPDWANQSAQLVAFTKGHLGEYIWAPVNLSSPEAVIPGRSLGLDATTWEQVLEWLNDPCYIPICLPSNLMGPDLIFALRLQDGRFFWVAVQVKRHDSTQDLDPSFLQHAFASVTLSKYFKLSELNDSVEQANPGLPNPVIVGGDFPIMHVFASHPSTAHETEDRSDPHPWAGLKIDTAAKIVDLGIAKKLGKQLERETVERTLTNEHIVSEEEDKDDMTEIYISRWTQFLVPIAERPRYT